MRSLYTFKSSSRIKCEILKRHTDNFILFLREIRGKYLSRKNTDLETGKTARILYLKKNLAVFLFFLLLFSSGCRLGYLFHAASGQFQLINGSIPVQKALDEKILPPDQNSRLLLVAKIKDFGEKDLGLRKTDSYETVFLTSNKNPIYAVSASPKDKLEQKTWDFPIVGKMPYLGFFDLGRAKEEGKKLSEENFDVFISAAGAYSTLGWFADPVTKNLLEGSTPALVETILHEMTHTTLYVPSQGAFNEGLAVLVGKVGALAFLEKTYGPSHPFTLEAKGNLSDERIFSRFIASFIEELNTLYRSPLTFEEKMIQREHVFAHALRKFTELKKNLKTDTFSGFGSIPINNAYIQAVGLYHSHFDLFEAALKKKGGSIEELLLFFKTLPENEEDLIQQAQKWVKEPTPSKM